MQKLPGGFRSFCIFMAMECGDGAAGDDREEWSEVRKLQKCRNSETSFRRFLREFLHVLLDTLTLRCYGHPVCKH